MPPNGELVRATGLCSVCDFKFRNEVVARYPEPAMPGGWAYVELRHLDAGEVSALKQPPQALAIRFLAQQLRVATPTDRSVV